MTNRTSSDIPASSQTSPLVSCVMPTADRRHLVPQAIRLFQRQNYPNRELVIVDDGADDISDLVPDDPMIRYVRLAGSRTLGAKRNLCVEASRGDLIMHWDDDDWMAPDRIVRQVEALLAAGAEICGLRTMLFHEIATGQMFRYSYPAGRRRWLAGNSLLYARAFWRRAPFPDVQVASDTQFVWQQRLDRSVVVPDERIYVAMIHPANTSRKDPRGPYWSVWPGRLEDVIGDDLAFYQALGERRPTRDPAVPARPAAAAPASAAPVADERVPTYDNMSRSNQRVCVVITTYSRPESLGRLLDDIERQWPGPGLDLRVYDDGTPIVDEELGERLRRRGWSYRRAAANHGKRRWWRWWNTILEEIRSTPASLFYFLQDDMRLCSRFFERSLALWAGIPDDRKASLDLHVAEHRQAPGTSCWTSVRARRVGQVVLSGWVDCAAFMCDRNLLEALRWRLDPIPESRWTFDELLSSGVGQQISVRAEQLGLAMYRVERSLTVHDESPSMMNQATRRLWSMRTVAFIDGEDAAREFAAAHTPVFAGLASIPSRVLGLEQVVEALLPQVDALGVYLNGYERVPRFLDRERVLVARSEEHGDRGDAGKFFWAASARGYHLTCDDDMAYPSDYVAHLIEGIERHGRRAAVSFHGNVLPSRIADYHTSRRLLHWSQGLAVETPVHVLGTGLLGYHTSAIRVVPGDFHRPNMADIWFALLGQSQRVPFVCLGREAGWLTKIPGLGRDSIYARARREAAAGLSEETRVVRAHHPWVLHGVPTAPGGRRAPVPEPHVRAGAPPRGSPLLRVRVAGPTRQAILVLPDRDHITTAVRKAGTYYELDLLQAIRSRDLRGTFVDVGAHFGNHTAFFGVECAAERIVAIEPSPAAYAGLLETVAENRLDERVSARRIAVHPNWRMVTLTPLAWSGAGRSRSCSNSGRVGIAPAAGAGDAPAAPLDEILEAVESVAVIKVDACRMSWEILQSGRRVLQRDCPLIAAEATSDRERHALHALLSPLGYRETGCYGWTPTWLWEAGRAD